jgi:hypothetical protein
MPKNYPEHQPQNQQQYQLPQYNQYPPQQPVYVVLEQPQPPRPSVLNLALYALITSILCFPLGLVLTIIFYAMAASAKKRLGYAPDGYGFILILFFLWIAILALTLLITVGIIINIATTYHPQ